jgi:hypothetical protein
LCSAELYSIKINKIGIIFICVPPKENKSNFTSNYDQIVNKDSKKWRIDNIIIPVVRSHPACKGMIFLPDRISLKEIIKNNDIFPELYDGFNLRYANFTDLYRSKYNDFNGIESSIQGKIYIKNYFKRREISNNVITLVIRDYGYDEARNTNYDELSKFVSYLISNNYNPVLVPDTDNAFKKIKNIDENLIFRDPCWNVGLRLALYELSLLNIFGPGGAGSVMLFGNKSACLGINSIVDNSLESNAKMYEKAGIQAGMQWSFLPKFQYISYKDESCENLILEFEEYFKRLNENY